MAPQLFRRIIGNHQYAACGEDIVMKSDGAQIRSYCYWLDCAKTIVKVLLRALVVVFITYQIHGLLLV